MKAQGNTPKKKRNYKREYEVSQSSPSQINDRSHRNAARAEMQKKGRVRKNDGKDVDHKDGNPRNNSTRNLRVQSKKANRSRNA
jgi:hypothetical protein